MSCDLETLADVRKVPEMHNIAPRNVALSDAVVQRAVAPAQAITAREAPPQAPPSQADEAGTGGVDTDVARGPVPTELDEPYIAIYEAWHISHSTPSMVFEKSTWAHTKTPIGHVVITTTRRYSQGQLYVKVKTAEKQAAQSLPRLDVRLIPRDATAALATAIHASVDKVLVVLPRSILAVLLIVFLFSVVGVVWVVDNSLVVIVMLIVFGMYHRRLMRILNRRVDKLDPELNRKIQMLVDSRDELAAASASPGTRWKHTVAYLNVEECQSESGTFEYLLILEKTEVPETAESEEDVQRKIEHQLETGPQQPEDSVPRDHMSMWMRGLCWLGGKTHHDMIEAQTVAFNELYDRISARTGGNFEP